MEESVIPRRRSNESEIHGNNMASPDDKVDGKSIGSFSSLRSRFEATTTASTSSSSAPSPNAGAGRQGWVPPSQRIKWEPIESTVTSGSSTPELQSKATSTPLPTFSTATEKTSKTLAVPRITEQPPSPTPSESIHRPEVDTRRAPSAKLEHGLPEPAPARGTLESSGLATGASTAAVTSANPREIGTADPNTGGHPATIAAMIPDVTRFPNEAEVSNATPLSLTSNAMSDLQAPPLFKKKPPPPVPRPLPTTPSAGRASGQSVDSSLGAGVGYAGISENEGGTAGTDRSAPRSTPSVPIGTRDRRRSDDRILLSRDTTPIPGITQAQPEETDKEEVVEKVSSLREKFDRPTLAPSPVVGRPAAVSRVASAVSLFSDSEPERASYPEGLGPVMQSNSREPNAQESAGSGLLDVPQASSAGRRSKTPPPPPPSTSRNKVAQPASVYSGSTITEHSSSEDDPTRTSSTEKDNHAGLLKAPVPVPAPAANSKRDDSYLRNRGDIDAGQVSGNETDLRDGHVRMGGMYSRSPEPVALSLPPRKSSLASGLTSAKTRTDIPSGSASVPPVLPPRQTSGGTQPATVAIPMPSPAPALPPRTPGPPALPDRNNTPDQSGRSGLSRSSSLAVGHSQTASTSRGMETPGHTSRTDSLKDVVKRSSTVLGRRTPGQGFHRSQRHGLQLPAQAQVEEAEQEQQGTDGWVPPPPPVRDVAAGSPASSWVVVPKASRSLDRYDSEEDGLDEQDEDEGENEPDPIAAAAFSQGAGRTGIANLKSSANRALAEYPDSTRVNRRAPEFVPRQRVTLGSHHHVHCFAVSGYKLCTGGSSVKVFDLTLADGKPILVAEPKHAGLDSKGKDIKVMAMSFRSPTTAEDEGRYLWCGTNGGHIWEVDTLTGETTDVKPGHHSASVSHVFRHDEWMVTLDELGKANVFGPFTGSEEVARRQTNAPCRALRTADRQNFATMLGAQLWTASGPAARSTTNSALRGPTLRIYDPSGFTSGNTAGKTTFTSEWTGAVTAATFDPFDRQSIYLAHEGGYVSIFDRDSLACRQVLKISPTDIVGLEFVGDYLWAGTRGGTINVYDTKTSPWTTINTWVAHPELPIQKIYADPFSIDQSGKYAVWTWGRDALHAWDGLLSVDWIESAMQEREAEYCRFRDLKILISSWNIDSSKPSDLSGSSDNQSFLQDCITSVDSPDVLVFGWQEVIDLNNRKLTAKTMLFGSKSKQDGRGNADGVSRAYRDWQDKLQMAVRMNTPPECSYTMLDTESMVGLMTVVFVKSTLRESLRDVAITTIKRGIGGVYGNKGAVVARMMIDDSSVCFINVHLAAGQSQKAARNADVAGILEEKAVFATSDTGRGYINGGDGSAILDHETVFLNGDLNYRIDQRRDNVISSVNAGELDYLLEHDQLRKEMKGNTSFRLRAFHEAPIAFEPTYKYTPNSTEYDQSEKKRIPAWCDRILWKSRQDERIECLHYRRYEPTVSDHRPISAAFSLTAKSIVPSKHAKIREEVEKEWFQREGDLMQRIVDAFEDYK